ncbi:transglycosylase SLT domain-containing protein, partial [Acinetobacter baumannii]
LLPLFGYVVDALRDADLPTEYALIPFVESGYRPAARSPSGPAGLWQMIAVTARNHDVPIRDGYDGRLSPVDSTRAAVRYLKTLHGMF